MKLHKTGFDFYYLITCSRGPGTESITVDKVSQENLKGVQFDPEAKVDFLRFGACTASHPHADEGFLVGVPKGTFPLAAILQIVVTDIYRYIDGGGTEQNYIPPGTVFSDNNQAYASAMMRVWLQDPIEVEGGDGNLWTCSNGWRGVDGEVLSERQLKLLMDATQLTLDDLAQWKCNVMKKTVFLALNGKLPKEDFGGN